MSIDDKWGDSNMPAAPKPIGTITHFFSKISVAVVKLNATLKVGEKIKIEGHGQSFEQAVDSMQVEHDQIKEAKKGMEVGMKVAKEVKEGDLVFKA
jgi:putative protease